MHFRTVLTATGNVQNLCVYVFLSMDTCDLRDQGLVSGGDRKTQLKDSWPGYFMQKATIIFSYKSVHFTA